MWDLPRPGFEPVSPALAGRFLTSALPGKSWRCCYNCPTSTLKGHLGLLGSPDQRSRLLFWQAPCLSGEAAPSLHPSGTRGGNSPGTAVPCGLSLHTTHTCVNSTFIKPTLNYPNLSVPSVSSWDFDRYSLIEAIYQAIIGHKHPIINYEIALQGITTEW